MPEMDGFRHKLLGDLLGLEQEKVKQKPAVKFGSCPELRWRGSFRKARDRSEEFQGLWRRALLSKCQATWRRYA
jgi:hypothetical protein